MNYDREESECNNPHQEIERLRDKLRAIRAIAFGGPQILDAELMASRVASMGNIAHFALGGQ